MVSFENDYEAQTDNAEKEVVVQLSPGIIVVTGRLVKVNLALSPNV